MTDAENGTYSNETRTNEVERQIVTPYSVQTNDERGIDYNKLIDQFGCDIIKKEMVERMERLTGKKAHHFFRREIFFAHRNFENILDAYEKSLKDSSLKPPGFYLYTGRGPSASSLHIGHVVPLLMTKYIQDAFDAPLCIMLSDDEKYFQKDLEFEEIEKMTIENIKDLIALGFDPKKTYIFSNIKSMHDNPNFYPLVCQIQKCLKIKDVQKMFGFKDTANVGCQLYPAVQCAPSYAKFMSNNFPQEMNCLIPCAIDQDPFFRLARDVAPRIGSKKPSLILSKFIPSLQGYQSKMSSSDSQHSAITLSDSRKMIEKKVNRYAFSGGKDSAEEHRKHGGNCKIDVSFAYLQYFLESEEELEAIRQDYTSGKMLSGELKKICIREVCRFVESFQRRREKITDEDVEKFMRFREFE